MNSFASCLAHDSVSFYTRNAIDYNPPGHLVHDAAVKLSKVFAETVNRFKEEQVTTAKKSFAKASAKPNSSVAALLEKRHRDELLGSLKPSSANLLVVPGTLLNHWEVRHVMQHASFKMYGIGL